MNWTKPLALLMALSFVMASSLGFEVASAAPPAHSVLSVMAEPCMPMPNGRDDKAIVAKCCAVGCVAMAAEPISTEPPLIERSLLVATVPPSFEGLASDVEIPPPRPECDADQIKLYGD